MVQLNFTKLLKHVYKIAIKQASLSGVLFSTEMPSKKERNHHIEYSWFGDGIILFRIYYYK